MMAACPGNDTCCNRPIFDRTMFPCSQEDYLRAQYDSLLAWARQHALPILKRGTAPYGYCRECGRATPCDSTDCPIGVALGACPAAVRENS